MGTKRRQTFGVALLGLLLGAALGLLAGWVAWPARYDSVTPDLLAAGYQTEYASLIAADYARTTNLDLARNRLARLGPAAITVLGRAAATNPAAARLLAELDAAGPANATEPPTTAAPAD